jgi:hypothetical protein
MGKMGRNRANDCTANTRFKMKYQAFLILAMCTGLSASEITVEHHDIPYETIKQLDVEIEFGLGQLDLSSNKDDDYILISEFHFSDDRYRPQVDFRRSGDQGKLRLESRNLDKKSFFGLGRQDAQKGANENRWFLEFIRTVPSSFRIDLGLGHGQLDFSEIRVKDLRLECGMSDVGVEFRKRNPERLQSMTLETGLGNVEAFGLGYANIENFSIECGLGSTVLVFNGEIEQDMKGQISVGLGSVSLEIPRNLGVQIEAESSFLSSIDLHDFNRLDNDLYRTENWQQAETRLYLVVEIGLGSVDIEWIE